jgi:hypothetical protein
LLYVSDRLFCVKKIKGCSFVPDAPVCVFWDEKKWSTEGCHLENYSGLEQKTSNDLKESC